MAALDAPYYNAIMGLEGFVPQASWDYKQYTNGYGTKALYPGETIDEPTARERYDAAINDAAKTVDNVAPNAPPGARAALISLTFNAGPGWTNAGLGDAVKAGDWQTAQDKFLQYNKAGGQVNPGLVNRRQQEAQWFGSPPAMGGAPVQTASAAPAPQTEQLAQPSQPNMPAFSWSPQQQQQAPVQFPQAQNAPLSFQQLPPPLRAPVDLARLRLALSQLPAPIRGVSFRG